LKRRQHKHSASDWNIDDVSRDLICTTTRECIVRMSIVLYCSN